VSRSIKLGSEVILKACSLTLFFSNPAMIVVALDNYEGSNQVKGNIYITSAH
jgi:hypothetical protein